MNEGQAASRYRKLDNERRPYLDRARQCAKLTIPHLLPQEGAKDEIDKAFAQYVRRIITDFEARALRHSLYEVFRQLIVSGNATLYLPSEGRARVYRLDRYVVARDLMGTIVEWVGVESVARASLPAEILSKLPPSQSMGEQSSSFAQEEIVDIYTHIYLDEAGRYAVYQEVDGMIIEGSEGEYEPQELPFLVLRYNKSDGESYGRGLVEEYLGDLRHLETLSKAIREFVAISSRVIPLISPNGTLTARDLVRA